MLPRTLFALALFSLAGMPAGAQTPADTGAAAATKPSKPAQPSVLDLRRSVNESYAAQDWNRMLQGVQALRQLRPYNQTYMSWEVLAEALRGDRAAAYDAMLAMQRQGLSHDFNSTPDSESLRGTEAYDHINELLIRQGEPLGKAEPLFELPSSLLLPTALAWDPSREAFLVANAREGAIWKVSRDGDVEELLSADAENGLWSIFGLYVDAASDRLWVSTAMNPNFTGYDEPQAGRSALVEFSLGELEPLRKIPVPVDGRPHRLGEIARGADGALYTVDTLLPIIYRLAPDADQLQAFVASADSVSFRGIATSGDGRMLYVADHELGVMVIDLEGKRAARLTGPDSLNLGGIEGLFWWDDHLVIIQNGISPQRILRLALGPDRASVTDVAALAVAQPFFDHPNFGTVLDDQLYFLANSHWVQGRTEPRPVGVARTDLNEVVNTTTPDMEKFWEDYQRQRGAGSNPAQD